MSVYKRNLPPPTQTMSLPSRHRDYQIQYRKAFPRFHFYFDSIDEHSKVKAKAQIEKLGGRVETFFSTRVDHVVTSRSIDDENKKEQDVLIKAAEYGMKIWKMEKLIKILKYLCEDTAPSHSQSIRDQTNLRHHLHQEKYLGTTERDRHAQRDDFIPFKNLYVIVRDLSTVYRDLYCVEYPKVKDNSDGDWPQLRSVGVGRCPFIKERQAFVKPKGIKQRQEEAAQIASKEKQLVPLQDSGSRINHVQSQSNLRQTIGAKETSKQHVNASGINSQMSQFQSQTSNIRSGQGGYNTTHLGVIQSKEVVNLKRKAIMNSKKEVKTKETVVRKVSDENRPGYCENCRDKFKNYDEHILTRKHLEFANDDRNFKELDQLINDLRRTKKPIEDLPSPSSSTASSSSNISLCVSPTANRQSISFIAANASRISGSRTTLGGYSHEVSQPTSISL